MEHLDTAQLLDLGQPRQSGPLFEQAKRHLSECADCRRAWVECQGLKALALEASVSAESRLKRRALQAARRVEVEERLEAGTGPDAAREILLGKRASVAGPSTTPLFIALLALAALAGIYYYSRRMPPAEAVAAAKTLPFEFQETPVAEALSQTATVEATPALPAQERAEERELDNEARRMLVAHLNKEGRAEATEVPVRPTRTPTLRPTLRLTLAPTRAFTPVPSPVPTLVPTAVPTQVPSLVPTLAPSPIPTQVPTLAPTEEASVNFQAPTPEGPQASLDVQNGRFSVTKAESAGFILSLPELSAIEIRVFDANGKSVKLICDGNYGPGRVTFHFNGKNDDLLPLPDGTYYARVMTRWFSRVEALELIP